MKQKNLKKRVKLSISEDISYYNQEVIESMNLKLVNFTYGKLGFNGALLKDNAGDTYVIIGRKASLWLFS